MGTREYRSNVFSMLLEEKKNALQVYNALNDTEYDEPDCVEIMKLENSIVLSVRNDASFIINGQLNIYEHQSTYNPNMALRELIYYIDIIRPMVMGTDLYSRRQIKIPTPHFCVFYNGVENRPAEETVKLSDSFEKKEDNPKLEVICRVININPGKNDKFLSKCKVLEEYTEFISTVNRKRAEKLDYKEAIEKAINECIDRNILRDFLTRRRNEVLEVMAIDMTWERREELIRKEEREEGLREGRNEGRIESTVVLTCKKLVKGLSVAEIADMLEENPEYIRKIVDIAEKYAPDYDVEKILEELNQSE